MAEHEIRSFIEGYARGDIPDYQMSALAMAIYLRGMTAAETAVLTDAMMQSGRLVDTSALDLPKADKHSTGGIGDKVSLVLAPLVACCGVAVPMISGRGLGITGGTLDKLESIAGYRTDLSEREFMRVVADCGCSIIGQTDELAPADKKLYALRDVTATVPSIPLITASIMCKKLAEGIDALVLDVKCGSGAFMKTLDAARELARSMVATGENMGKRVVAVISGMDEPLGQSVGNALEVREAVACLRDEGPADLMEVVLALSAQMLLATDVAEHEDEARALLQEKLDSGAALEKFKRMVTLQGGDVAVVEKDGLLPSAGLRRDIVSQCDGTLASVDAEIIGKATLLLGGGRLKTSDSVDPAVGVASIAKAGTAVSAGDILADLHANEQAKLDEAEEMARNAFEIANRPAEAGSRIKEIITE